MRGLAIALAAALLLGPLAATGVAEEERDPTAPCVSPAADVVLEDLTFTAGGETVHACLATPSTGKTQVDTLVVFAHGLGWTVQAGWLDHMAETVQRGPDTAVVATNYRDNFGFPVTRGAEDLVTATELALEQLPGVQRTVLLGVSMGGATSGNALVMAPALTGSGLYDHWIDVEGVTNVLETYTEARAVGLGIPFAADVADAIERDLGGSPAEVPQAYLTHSPALRADDMAAAGLQSAIVVHAPNDGLVPYNQGREMAGALVAAGIPAELHTVTRTQPGQTAGTTPTAHALDPDQDPNEQLLHLAGHASEADRDHPVMDTALERLFALLQGKPVTPGYAEFVVDPATGQVPG